MKIPLSWVGLFSPVSSVLESMGAKSLAHEYSIRTAEIEGREEYSFDDRVVVARVVSTSKHPDSDHLNLVTVELGSLQKHIVCGAENVTKAKYVVLATEGAVLPGGFEIKKATIRGQDSEGMICSLDELGLAEERAPGIFELETEFDTKLLESHVGKPFSKLPIDVPPIAGEHVSFTLADTVFEIDNKFITNRPDLFSVEGNAREFSALFDLPFRPYSGTPVLESGLKVEIASDRVIAYRLAKVSGVKAKPSPFGVATLLRRCGLAVKLDLIDMTNYVMTELGQPTHAFDADKVEGNVVVRLANDGEFLLALDGKEYRLTKEDLVIADSKKVLAIAGVIGGASSAVSETTTNLLLESATFDPHSVRLTAQRTGCRTDASTRYEKSIDPLLTGRALSRLLDLISFFGNAVKVEAGFNFLDTSKLKKPVIDLSLDFVDSKLGIQVPKADALKILRDLGFVVVERTDREFGVIVPSWRATKDVSIKEDLVEEIGRVYGYLNVPESCGKGDISLVASNLFLKFRNATLAYFSGCGMMEAYAYSFSNLQKDSLSLIEGDSDAVKVLNAVSVEYTHMRRSPAPLLFGAVSENVKRHETFAFFEIGKIHRKKKDGAFSENRSLSGVSVGWTTDAFRDSIVSYLEKMLPKADVSVVQGCDAKKFPMLHPGKSGTFVLNGEEIGSFGSIHPKVSSNYSLDGHDVRYFQIDPEILLSLVAAYGEPAYSEPTKFPGIDRELNFVMDEKTSTGSLSKHFFGASELVVSVTLVDVYRDESRLGADKKSVTFSYRVESPVKTVTDVEAGEIQARIVSSMSRAGFDLRS